MRKLFKEWKLWILGLSGVVIVGFLLRLYNLTLLPVFADEAIYIRWAQVMKAESTLRFLPLSDGKQPLFMWTVIPFLEIFKDPLFAGRFVSVLTSVFTIVGIFLVTYYLFKDKKISLLASFFYALSPFAVFFDRMALVDSMLTAFGIWIFFLAVLTVRSLRLDFAMLSGFALGGALLTKSPGIFFAILLPITWIFSNWPKIKGRFMLHFLKLTSLFAVTYLISFGMYNILRLGPNFRLIATRNYDYVFSYSRVFTSPLDPLFGHLGGIFSYSWMLFPAGLSLLALASLLVRKSRVVEKVVILIWVAFPILATAEYSKGVTARYLLFILPFICVLAASIFLAKSEILKRVGIIFLLIFLVQSIFLDIRFVTKVETAPLPIGERSGYLEEWTAGTGIKDVADFIKEEAENLPAGRQVVVGTEGFFGTLPNGLEMYLQGTNNVVVIGVGVAISDVHPSLIESKKAGNKTYLLVNDTRFKGDAEKLGLELLAAYPKAFRKPNSREYSLYGPRETLLFFEVTERALDVNKSS